MGLSAFDLKTRQWKQVYVSNQVPFRSGVTLRTSDPSYTGPGVRFISLLEPTAGDSVQSRVTIMPLSGHRALQEFEESRDGGKTWKVVFKGEHRLRTDAGAMRDHPGASSLYQYAAGTPPSTRESLPVMKPRSSPVVANPRLAPGHVRQTLGAFRVGAVVLTRDPRRSPSGHRA